MEFILPLIAIGGVYLSSQRDPPNEGFTATPSESLPVELEDATGPNEYEKQQYYKNMAASEIYEPEPVPAYRNVSTAIPGQAPVRFPDYGHEVPPSATRYRDIDMSTPQHGTMGLEQRMGYGTLNKPKKTEQYSLFSPQKNISFPDGAPCISSILQERTFVSNNMDGVAPIQPQRESYGSFVGADGSILQAGANPSMERGREVGRQVDQMRSVNNPKFGGSKYATYEGLQGPASAPIKKGLDRDQVGVRVQNEKTDSSYERGNKWMVPSGGVYVGSKPTENVQPATVRRADPVTYTAPANSDIKGHPIYGIEKECSRTESNPPLPPVIRGGTAAGQVNITRPVGLTEPKRSAYENTNYIGAIGRVVGRAIAAVQPSDTFREMYSGATQSYITPSTVGTNGSAQRIYSEETHVNRPRKTMRELAENAPHFLQVTAGPSGGGYSTQQTQPADTNRQTTGISSYMTAAKGPSQTSSRDHEYQREQKDTHNSTLHSSCPRGGLGLFHGNVHHVPVADDSRQRRLPGGGYVTGPSVIPSSATHGIHSSLEYNYKAPVENARPNVDRSQYNPPHSNLTVGKIAEGFSKLQPV
jgi:hypothetical protein